MEDIKGNISQNLVLLRKSRKLTQQELAANFNYSDKAISRWETGESLPDISVLLSVCEFYGVDFEWLIRSHDDAPPPRAQNKDTGLKVATILLFATFMFAIAVVVFVYGLLRNDVAVWTAFIWALPPSCLFAFFMSRKWWRGPSQYIMLSCTVWTMLAAIYAQALFALDSSIWYIFLLGIPVQVMIILFSYISKHSAQPAPRQK